MKTKKLRELALIPTAILLVIFPPALASQQAPSVYIHGGNAESLLSSCASVDKMGAQTYQVPPKMRRGYLNCFGYILGVVDMHNALNAVLPIPQDNTYCVPDNATATQLAKVVVKYGNDQPEELKQAALLLVSNAFIRGFPCK